MGREFTPFEIGDRFRISPPGTPPSRDARIELVIAPGAFGSGEHETTASCLELLATLPDRSSPKENSGEKCGLAGARVLDLGSGTGILAIAALKLGARSAVCVDVDPVAVATCRLNCDINGVASQVEHVCGGLEQTAAELFDLIVANLYGDILLRLAEALVARSGPDAPLLLSGILLEDHFQVRRRYEELGCTAVRARMLAEFSTLLLRGAG